MPADEDVFVPDILVAAGVEDVTRRGIERPPLLVVEILTPSTRSRDRGLKATRYAELGVSHYWIVDPDLRCIECFRLVRGVWHPVARAESDGELSHPDWEGLTLRLESIWP